MILHLVTYLLRISLLLTVALLRVLSVALLLLLLAIATTTTAAIVILS